MQAARLRRELGFKLVLDGLGDDPVPRRVPQRAHAAVPAARAAATDLFLAATERARDAPLPRGGGRRADPRRPAGRRPRPLPRRARRAPAQPPDRVARPARVGEGPPGRAARRRGARPRRRRARRHAARADRRRGPEEERLRALRRRARHRRPVEVRASSPTARCRRLRARVGLVLGSLPSGSGRSSSAWCSPRRSPPGCRSSPAPRARSPRCSPGTARFRARRLARAGRRWPRARSRARRATRRRVPPGLVERYARPPPPSGSPPPTTGARLGAVRILLTIHHALDPDAGAPGATIDLGRALREQGHDVEFLSHDDMPARLGPRAREPCFRIGGRAPAHAAA